MQQAAERTKKSKPANFLSLKMNNRIPTKGGYFLD
jgi:hypothetical protein